MAGNFSCGNAGRWAPTMVSPLRRPSWRTLFTGVWQVPNGADVAVPLIGQVEQTRYVDEFALIVLRCLVDLGVGLRSHLTVTVLAATATVATAAGALVVVEEPVPAVALGSRVAVAWGALGPPIAAALVLGTLAPVAIPTGTIFTRGAGRTIGSASTVASSAVAPIGLR